MKREINTLKDMINFLMDYDLSFNGKEFISKSGIMTKKMAEDNYNVKITYR